MPALSRGILPEPELERRVRSNLLAAEYRFAKTMPENPHWYTLRKTWTDDAAFCEAVQFIRDNGYVEIYKRSRYQMYNLNGYKYWTMGAPINNREGGPCTILINRAKAAYDAPYDAIAERYDALFTDAASHRENEEIFATIGARPDERVLDIGCGTGLFLEQFGLDFQDYVGVDPSAQMLGRFVTQFPEYRGNIIHGRFEDFFDTGGGFDLIVSLFGSINYVDPAYFSRIYGLLKPRGRAFLMFYQDGYQPVTYDRLGVEFEHYPAPAYDLSAFEISKHRDTFLIATRTAP